MPWGRRNAMDIVVSASIGAGFVECRRDSVVGHYNGGPLHLLIENDGGFVSCAGWKSAVAWNDLQKVVFFFRGGNLDITIDFRVADGSNPMTGQVAQTTGRIPQPAAIAVDCVVGLLNIPFYPTYCVMQLSPPMRPLAHFTQLPAWGSLQGVKIDIA